MSEERLNELFSIVNEGYSSIQEREIRDYITNLQQKVEQLETQQKEFINYLENEIKFYKNRDTYIVADILGSYDLNDIKLKLLEEILSKFKKIIGSDINVGSKGDKE